ncbi:MAG: hypothetical protein V8Q27_00625 [Eubacteriales bacterium]
MEVALSEDILGRTFNGIGEPIDGLGDIKAEMKRDVNGQPLNPVPVSIRGTISVPVSPPSTV